MKYHLSIDSLINARMNEKLKKVPQDYKSISFNRINSGEYF